MKRFFIFQFSFLLIGIFGFLDCSLPKQLPSLDFFSPTKTAVPICPESQNKLQNVLNNVFNTTVFESKRPSDQLLAVCKNTFTEHFKERNEENCSDTCDYSYVVAIKSRRNGGPNLTTVCEGLLLCDCTIATTYECTKLGEGLWVTFQNGNTFEVVCIKEAQLPLNNVLGTIFVVQLVIDVPSCKNLANTFPTFADKNSVVPVSAGITSGYFISRVCSSCNLLLKPIPSVLVSASLKLESTSVEIKVVIPNDPDAICRPFFGGAPFVDKNCNVHGIVFRKPNLLVSTLYEVPAANQIDIGCTITIVQPTFSCCN